MKAIKIAVVLFSFVFVMVSCSNKSNKTPSQSTEAEVPTYAAEEVETQGVEDMSVPETMVAATSPDETQTQTEDELRDLSSCDTAYDDTDSRLPTEETVVSTIPSQETSPSKYSGGIGGEYELDTRD